MQNFVIGPRSVFPTPLTEYEVSCDGYLECEDDFLPVVDDTAQYIVSTQVVKVNHKEQAKNDHTGHDRKQILFNNQVATCRYRKNDPPSMIKNELCRLMRHRPNLQWVNPTFKQMN